MKRLIISLLLLAVTATADDTWYRAGDLWYRSGGNWARASGGTTLWTDTNSPALLYYLQETQPSNYIADVSGNNYFMEGEGFYPFRIYINKSSGYWFSGNGHRAFETNTPMTLGTATNVTFACWMRPTDANVTGKGVMYIGSYASSQGKYFVLNQSGAVIFRVNGQTSGAGALSVANATPTNEWRHIAATYDGFTLRVYTNGVQAGTNYYSITLDSTGLKYFIASGYAASADYSGYITQPRVYNRTIAASEALDLYNGLRTNAAIDLISTNGLVSYLPMTNAYDTVYDFSVNNAHLVGWPTFANQPTFQTTNHSHTNYAVQIDGSDDSLDQVSCNWLGFMDDISRPRTNEFTLCTWFNINAHVGYCGIAGRSPLTTTDGYGFQSGSTAYTNYLRAVTCDGTATNVINSDQPVSTQSWHFAVLRRSKIAGTDTNLLDMYYDGVWQSQTNADTFDINMLSSAEFSLGSRGAGSLPMKGWVMEGRYYTNDLSNSAIDDIYNNSGTNNNEARFTLP